MSSQAASGVGILIGVIAALIIAGAAGLNAGWAIGLAVVLSLVVAAGLRALSGTNNAKAKVR